MHLAWTSIILFSWLCHSVVSYTALSNEQSFVLKSILPLPIDSYLSPRFGSILAPLLIPRPSGSSGASKVLAQFQQFFSHNLSNWNVTLDAFNDRTPRGTLKFTNFIATRDPPGVRPGDVGRLTVTAHYDSKWFPLGSGNEGFIGATDSAVPCAMLMYAALALDGFLTARDEYLRENDELDDPIGLQVPSLLDNFNGDYFL
jgi:glutaminyl-peptide cyclotransferase